MLFLKQNILDLLKTNIQLRYIKDAPLLDQAMKALSPEERKFPIIINEIQKVPTLLDEVHSLIENKSLNLILSGSSARKLKQKTSNLLDRHTIKYNLYPLVYPALQDRFDLKKISTKGYTPSMMRVITTVRC